MPRFVCLFSDRTKSSWESSPNASSHPDVKVLYFDVGIDEPVDLAIMHAEFARGRSSFAEGETIELNAVVKATGDKLKNTLICQLGAQKSEQPFELAKGEQRTLEFRISSKGLTPGFQQLDLRLETDTDALAFNNARFMTFAIHKKPRVLVLADDVTKVADFAFALEVLNHAVERKTPQEKARLDDYAAIFLIDVAAPSDALWQKLTTYAQERGVCVIPAGERLQQAAYNSTAARQILPATFVDSVKAEPGVAWNLKENLLQHPFMQPFRAWVGRPEIDFMRYERRAAQYWQVTPIKDKDVAVAIEYKDNDGKLPPAVVERVMPKGGKVLLLTTPLDDRTPAWNNYVANITSFYLTRTSLCASHQIAEPTSAKVNHIFGQAPPIVRQDLSLPKGTLLGPDLSEEIRFDDKQQWVGDRLAKAGDYQVTGANPEQQKTEALARFSINESSDESDLSRIPKEEVEAALGKDALIPQDRHTSLRDSISGYWDEPVELSPWLMIGLLFLLALENLLANRFYRREGDSAPA